MRRLLLVCCLLLPILSHAAEFEIYQSGYKPLQLALLVKSASANEQALVANVVRNDLDSSQSFKAMNPLSFLDTPEQTWAKVEYDDWRIIGADTLALVDLTDTAAGWHAEVQVHDPFRNKLLSTVRLDAPHDAIRQLAHSISNHIYQSVLGIPGYFNSHVLYVRKHGEYSDLIYMDQDMANQQVVGSNFTLLLSPDWSPDGQVVALNTYVGNRPRLEFFNLRDGSRTAFGNFKGLNSTPEFSPDGRYVAATLSYTGDINIYIYDIKADHWQRITRDTAIDTTPTWSPDGKQIAFVSNRTGDPQIYRMNADGSDVTRVTTIGNYNTSPVWSPLGDRIAFVTKKDWAYALATVRVDGSDIRYLATGQQIESPTWSPNGQMLMYAAGESGIRRVYRIPAWGGTPEAVTPPNIDASDPAWSRH
ncbi:MAG TPA: Tol-Pal system beta propeller repeat protein TolB [Mariprofundaceae bacterium]|nr:Tol-Pal system beta propeller repeat protein TolB [Mariprofundaceae bacterium]